MTYFVMEANFDALSNDLYWKVYAGEDGFIRWTGYNDRYWWDNVSTTKQFKEKVGEKTGRIFELDPKTNSVTVRADRVALKGEKK